MRDRCIPGLDKGLIDSDRGLAGVCSCPPVARRTARTALVFVVDILAVWNGVTYMGVAIRVIPCLDVDAGRVVKGVNFENLRDAGDPVELAATLRRRRAPTS